MKSFREWLVESEENKLLIKLEDGDMKIISKPVESDNYELTITYNGYKTIFVTNNDYEVISFKGQALDALTLFNFVIQQFHIDGIVKSK